MALVDLLASTHMENLILSLDGKKLVLANASDFYNQRDLKGSRQVNLKLVHLPHKLSRTAANWATADRYQTPALLEDN